MGFVAYRVCRYISLYNNNCWTDVSDSDLQPGGSVPHPPAQGPRQHGRRQPGRQAAQAGRQQLCNIIRIEALQM